MFQPYSTFRAALMASSIPSSVFWPYFLGTAALIVGLLSTYRHHESGGENRLLRSGPFLFAVAMAIFGADHLVAAKFVAMIVPSWMPWHLFWAYFVGIALIAAALSLSTGIHARLAAGMLGLMIFVFVLSIHTPNWIAAPLNNVRLTILLRDLSLSAGVSAYAASRGGRGQSVIAPALSRASAMRHAFIRVACFLVAVPILVFGVDHFLNPRFAPGIPQENPALFVEMPVWIPGHAFWGWLTGAIFVICALGMMTRKYSFLAAKTLGTTVLTLVVLVYFPLTVEKASNIADGLNYLAIHFALAGSAFMIATAVKSRADSSISIGESPVFQLGGQMHAGVASIGADMPQSAARRSARR